MKLVDGWCCGFLFRRAIDILDLEAKIKTQVSDKVVLRHYTLVFAAFSFCRMFKLNLFN